MGIATIPTIIARARGRPPEEMIMICTFGKRWPKEKTPKGPNGGGNGNDDSDDDDGNDGGDDGGDPVDDDPFRMHLMCCAACCHSISKLYTSVDECFQAMEAMRQHMEDLERVVEDDYKFLNRNVQKLFGMIGNMKCKWRNSCGKYH
jgi:hypothetical protein